MYKCTIVNCSLNKYVDEALYNVALSLNCELKTSSPAIAERPRDASCLSVVSFKSAVFYYRYFGFTCDACN